MNTPMSTDTETVTVTAQSSQSGAATEWWEGLPTALVAAATGWCSLLSWRGFGLEPSRYIGPLVVAAVLIALTGWAVRRWTTQEWLALPAQLLVVGWWLLHHVTGAWLPRPSAVDQLAQTVYQGALDAQQYASPVSTEHPEFHIAVLGGGILILLAVDVIACGLRQAALSGLPLLLTITISASLLLAPVPWSVFAFTATGWLVLLALREGERIGRWGRLAGSAATGSAAVLGLRIGLVCALVAIITTGALSADGRRFASEGAGPGSIVTNNPLLDLRRNLRQSGDIPLVEVKTDGQPETPDPAYLRTTVLDRFTGSSWVPTPRDVDDTTPAEGSLPNPPGLGPLSIGATHTWSIAVQSAYRSTWLPLPFPTSTLKVDSGWRYNPGTQDVIAEGGQNAAGSSYIAATFDLNTDRAQLRESGLPQASIAGPMTDLPRDLPPVFANTARQVTASATNDYDRAVLLQDWFRSAGGFTYSTEPAPGSGISTLQRFITTDRIGYCEQFAAAMAVMARTLHIPARVSVGFLRPDRVGKGDYVFSSRDLHSWPELYFTGVGWIRFEPTPADRTGPPPNYTTEQQVDQPTTAPTPTALPSAGPNSVKPKVDPLSQDGGGSSSGTVIRWLLILAGVILVVLLLLLPRALHVFRRRRRWSRARTPQEIADAAWRDVQETALDLSLPWTDHDTVRANGRRLESGPRGAATTLEGRDAMREVVGFVERTRYARPDDAGQSRDVRAAVDLWREETFSHVERKDARRATWVPRSLKWWR